MRIATVAAWAMLAAIPVALAESPPATANADATASDSGTSWHEKTEVDVEGAGESWIGVEAYRRAVSAYSGATSAPFNNLRQDGFRLRVVAGNSLYNYTSGRYDPVSDNNVWVRYRGLGRFIDVLPGWQFSGGETTVKAFIGYDYQSNIVGPYDPDLKIQRTASGVKGALEIWQNWTPKTWSSVDLSVARANITYSAQVRSGVRFEAFGTAGWSIGPEFAQVGNTQTTLRRAGLLLRYEDLGYEFTISGGVARSNNDVPTGYVNAQYLRRF